MFGELDSNLVLNWSLERTDSASGLMCWRLLIRWNSCLVTWIHLAPRKELRWINHFDAESPDLNFFFEFEEMSIHGWASVSDCCTLRLFDFALDSRHDARTRWVTIEIHRARLISQIRSFEFAGDRDDGPTVGASCRCLNHSTSMGGTRSKVEGGDRHDLEPEGRREDTRHKIYTGSGSRSSYPTSCLG
jgi:hypothetical protein